MSFDINMDNESTRIPDDRDGFDLWSDKMPRAIELTEFRRDIPRALKIDFEKIHRITKDHITPSRTK